MATIILPSPPGERVIPLRRRPDLDCRSFGAGQREYWRIKDPLSQRHYELGREEFFVLEQLDGNTSVEQIQRACQRQFAPQRVSLARLLSFISRLHAIGLLVCDAPGQHVQILERQGARRRENRTWGWANLLALRLAQDSIRSPCSTSSSLIAAGCFRPGPSPRR